MQSLQSGALELPVPELVERVLERSGYLEALEAERTIEAQGRIENLQELVGVAREYQATAAEPTLSDFLQEISLYSDQDAIRGEESLVTLMTLHNAKGLEFRAVFMIGMEEGDLPALALDRGAGRRGGAAARLRRHDARAGAADADARVGALALGRRAATTCPRASSTSCPSRGRARAAAAGLVDRLRLAGDVTPREDVPELSTGDSVRHGTLGEGVVTADRARRRRHRALRATARERRLMLDYAPLERI